MLRQKRISKKSRVKSLSKLHQVELQAEPLKYNPPQSKKTISHYNFQTNLMIATVFLLVFGLTLYFVAILKIDSHIDSQSFLITLNKTAHIRDVQQNKNSTSNNKAVQINKSKTKTTPSFVDIWIDRIKKLSTEISLSKLIRAQKMLKGLSTTLPENLYNDELATYVRDYEINNFEQKSICIVVPTYNNMKDARFQKNIDSILQQEYKNYKVIIIDDASNDGTSSAIEEHISNHLAYKQGRIKIQKNKERKMALLNILDAAQNFCNQKDIFMVIDGDDYLLGKYVFKLFNAAFSSRDAWVVYSNFLTPNDKIGYSRRYPIQIMESQQFRRVLFIISHLRAFYTKLLLSIKKQDLKDESGQYFHAANDVAIFMPILEMASDHIIYLPEINYYYNSNTGLNNHQQKKKEQLKNDRLVRSRPKYPKLEQLFADPERQLRRVVFYDENTDY